MKNTSQSKTHFADALGRTLEFAVLTKKSRIQVLVKPSDKRLRKCGKRQWQLFGTVEGDHNARSTFLKMIQSAVQKIGDDKNGKKPDHRAKTEKRRRK